MTDETQYPGEPQDMTAEPPADDLDAFLREYDAQQPAPQPDWQQQQDANYQQQDYQQSNYQQSEIDGLRSDVNRLHQNQAAQRDQHDIEAVVAEGEKILRESDIPVSDGWVRRFIASEAALNPELVQAWDHRYENQQNLNRAEKLVRQALSKMRAEAKAMPDRDATQDRNAVVAAMRTSASNYGRMPEQKMPDFANMTDNEFMATRRRMFGY